MKIGQLVNRADYPDLWALASPVAITDAAWATDKTKFSSGNGTTTFRIPDWRRYFLRGADATYLVGTSQLDAVQGHLHDELIPTAESGGLTTIRGITSTGSTPITGLHMIGAPRADGTNGTPRIDTETRPMNVAVNFIIRALL